MCMFRVIAWRWIAFPLILGCGFQPNPDGTFSGTDGSSSVTGGVIAPSGASLGSSAAIRIAFSKPIDTSSVNLTGGVITESYLAQWSNGNTVLSLSPQVQWSKSPIDFALTVRSKSGYYVSTQGNYTLDASTAPAYTINFATASVISTNTPIVLIFTKTMAVSGCVYSGTLGSQVGAFTWTQSVQSNDQLTINPINTWSTGSQTLTIQCADTSGNLAAPALNLNYTVVNGELYVHSTLGLDTNPGTALLPFQTIQPAIDQAAKIFTNSPGFIRVAAGIYNVCFRTANCAGVYPKALTLKTNVQLLGGYDAANWNNRDWNTYITRIRDNTNIAGSNVDYNTVIFVINVSGTLVEGFEIVPADQDYSVGVRHIGVGLTIRNNKLLTLRTTGIGNIFIYGSYASTLVEKNTFGFTGSGSISSVSTFDNNSSPTVQDNILNPAGIQLDSSTGIVRRNKMIAPNQTLWTNNSGIIVENNFIYATANNSRTILLWNGCLSCLNGERHILRNNTVVSNISSANAAVEAINNDAASRPIVENNIFYNTGGGRCYHRNGGLHALRLNNNVFFGCTAAYYLDGGSPLTTIGTVEAAVNGGGGVASGNVYMDPLFTNRNGIDGIFSTMSDNDTTLQSGSPCNVKQGGLNGVAAFWDFATDYLNALLRTGTLTCAPSNTGAAGWSIGAYEQDN
jgi:hypothetical protein